MLAASLEDGTLALFDTVHTMEVRPRRTRMLRYQAMLHALPPSEAGAGQAWGVLAGPPVASPPLLPRAWGLLLRLLLQRGLPEAVFRELGALSAALAGSGAQASSRTLQAEQSLERLEGEVRGLGGRLHLQGDSCTFEWSTAPIGEQLHFCLVGEFGVNALVPPRLPTAYMAP